MSAEFQSWWQNANLPGDPYEQQQWRSTVEAAFELGRSVAPPAPGAPQEAAPELLRGWMRYEKARKLSPRQWAELHARNLAGETFDDMIDALPESSTPAPEAVKDSLRTQAAAVPAVVQEPPFGSKRAAALALYRPPFRFTHGYIYDAANQMVADQDGFEGAVETHVAARVRGWGRIGYLPEAAALQDEVGQAIADALTAYWGAALAGGDEKLPKP